MDLKLAVININVNVTALSDFEMTAL